MHKFSVSEARTAMACPRIFYFDEARFRRDRPAAKKVTRLWIDGGDGAVVGVGKFFHDQIERFQKKAAKSQSLATLLGEAVAAPDVEREERIVEAFQRFLQEECLDLDGLCAKPVPAVQAFLKAVRICMSRFASHVQYGLAMGMPVVSILEQLFGDLGKRVDVTFRIGPEKTAVRVTGVIDCIFMDLTTGTERILDYKLTPASSPSKDVLQSALYALMHHQQHRSTPGVCVVYLHPEVRNVSVEWHDLVSRQSVVLRLLASMTRWSEFDEKTQTGLKPPGEPSLCGACRWREECQSRLGPVSEGGWYATTAVAGGASDAGSSDNEDPATADIEVHEPPESPPAEQPDDEPTAGQPSVTLAEAKEAPAAATEETASLRLGVTAASARLVSMPAQDLTMHAAVCGSAGSGKTWMAKVIVEEVVRLGVPAILIDPQGDLVQFLESGPLPGKASKEERRLQGLFRDAIDVRVWTPGTSHARRLSLSPFCLPSPDDLVGVESPERREEELHSLLGAAASSLVRFAAAKGDEQVQQSFVHEVLRRLGAGRIGSPGTSAGQITISDVVAAMMDPESCGIDNPNLFIAKAEREKLARKINAMVSGPASMLFSGGVPLDIDALVAPGPAGRVPLNVLYLNALTDDAQKQFVVATVAAEVYRWMISTSSAGGLRLLWFVDEAKDYLPAGMAKPPAKEPLVRLFSQGRKYGVGCVICTQSPRSVDYNVFANASTKLIGRIEASQDLERVSEWFSGSGSPPVWLKTRLGASDKSFVGRWPSIPPDLEGIPFRARPLYSRHEGAWSPERVEQACRDEEARGV